MSCHSNGGELNNNEAAERRPTPGPDPQTLQQAIKRRCQHHWRRLASCQPPSLALMHNTRADLAKARLGCIDPNFLAELLQLTASQRAQLMAKLQQCPEALRADGKVPVEVGLGFTTAIKARSH